MSTTPGQDPGPTSPPMFGDPAQDLPPEPSTTTTRTAQGEGDSSTTEQAKETAGMAASEAKSVGGTAASEAKSVAGTAASEARDVAGEAKAQVRDLAGEARTQITEQSRTQRDRLTQALDQAAEELRSMVDAGGGDGVATELVRQAATRARDLSAFLGRHEPGDLVTEVRRFARRRPAAFLFGAVAAGVLAGRTSKGVSQDAATADSREQRDVLVPVSAAGAPVPTVPPVVEPAYAAAPAAVTPVVADATEPSRDPNLGPSPLGTGYGGPSSPGGRP